MEKVKVESATLQIGKKIILDKIELSVEEGTICGLVGRNGSGKTMLMKCICGFMKLTDGKIVVDGKVIGKDIDFPNEMGLIIETPGFVPHMSGYKNLELLAKLNGIASKQRIRETMEKVGLNPDLKLSVQKYSLGMRQRLGIAQAIMESPRLLVLDEPMNGLDKSGVEEMRSYLLQLKKEGTTMIISSHTEEDIKVLCDAVYEMDGGKITRLFAV